MATNKTDTVVLINIASYTDAFLNFYKEVLQIYGVKHIGIL